MAMDKNLKAMLIGLLNLLLADAGEDTPPAPKSTAKPAPKAKATPEPAEEEETEEPSEEPETEEPSEEPETVKDAVARLIEDDKRDEAVAILKKFGAKAVADVPKDKQAKCLALLINAINS